MSEFESLTPEQRIKRHAKYQAGLVWHVVIYAVVNVILLGLDTLEPRSVEWAFWISGAWSIGLALHGVAYLIDGRRYLK